MAGHKSWTIGEEVIAADFQGYMQDQVVTQFPNVAARDTWPTPPAGALCVTTDTGKLWQRVGGTWIAFHGGQIARANNAGSVSWVTLQQTLVTLTGVPVVAQRRYSVRMQCRYRSDTANTISRWAINRSANGGTSGLLGWDVSDTAAQSTASAMSSAVEWTMEFIASVTGTDSFTLTVIRDSAAGTQYTNYASLTVFDLGPA